MNKKGYWLRVLVSCYILLLSQSAIAVGVEREKKGGSMSANEVQRAAPKYWWAIELSSTEKGEARGVAFMETFSGRTGIAMFCTPRRAYLSMNVSVGVHDKSTWTYTVLASKIAKEINTEVSAREFDKDVGGLPKGKEAVDYYRINGAPIISVEKNKEERELILKILLDQCQLEGKRPEK